MKKRFYKKDIEYINSILKPGNYITLIAHDFQLSYNDCVFPYGRPLSAELKNYLRKSPALKITKDNIYWLIGEHTRFRQATKDEIIQYHLQREHYELIPKLKEQESFNEGCKLTTLEDLSNPPKGTLIVNPDGTTNKIGENGNLES